MLLLARPGSGTTRRCGTRSLALLQRLRPPWCSRRGPQSSRLSMVNDGVSARPRFAELSGSKLATARAQCHQHLSNGDPDNSHCQHHHVLVSHRFAAPIQSPELHRPLDCKCVVRCGLGAHWLGQKGSDVNVRTFLTGAASCQGVQRHCADSFAIDHQRGVGSIGARSLNHPGRIALNKTQGAGWQGPAVSTTYHTGIWARARTSGWMAKLPCRNGDCRLIPPERDT